jgi:ketosteroid isomerase-like protein
MRTKAVFLYHENDMSRNHKFFTEWLTVPIALGIVLCVVTPLAAQDSLNVANVVHAYDRALRTGDSTAALALLTDDAVILESGGLETREEYRSHHLPSDIEFAQAVEATQSPLRVKVRGDVAWVASTSVAQGQFRGRPVNSVGAELMILNRGADGWRIAAIHWSSRSRRP